MIALSSPLMTFCRRFRSSWHPQKCLSLDIVLSGWEDRSNVVTSMGTTWNDLDNHVFDLPFLWWDPEMRMGTWDT
jgi:hypothetical protein